MQHEYRERATIHSTGGPTPTYIASIGKLIEALKRHPTPCALRRTTMASVVRTIGRRAAVLCHGCSIRYTGATPLERRAMQIEMAVTR